MTRIAETFIVFISNQIFSSYGNPKFYLVETKYGVNEEAPDFSNHKLSKEGKDFQGIPGEKELIELEKKAYAKCESDGKLGLTWAEVEPCKKIYGELATAIGIPLPTKADFDNFDTDKDGVLLFDEWLKSIKKAK